MALEISELVSDAWSATWRHRRLWLLGFLAGNATGSCSGGGSFPTSFPGDETANPFAPGVLPEGPEGEQIARMLEQAAPLIASFALAIAIIAIVFGVVSIAAQAGVIAGGASVLEGGYASAGAAWRRGWRLFWRMLGLTLLAFFFLLAIAGVTIGPAALAGARGGAGAGGALAAAVPGLVLLLVLGSVVSVVLAYAQRAIVIDDASPVQSVAMALGLIRREFMNTLLVWVIGLALSIGAGIAVVIGALLLLIPFGIVIAIGVVLAGANLEILGIPLAVVAGVMWLAAILVAAAAVNTYLWHYWTLAYLRLTGRGSPRESVIGAPA